MGVAFVFRLEDANLFEKLAKLSTELEKFKKISQILLAHMLLPCSACIPWLSYLM